LRLAVVRIATFQRAMDQVYRGNLIGGGRGASGNGAWAAKILPMDDEVCEEKRKADASPDDGFVDAITKIFPAGDSADDTHFEKNDSNRVAADHPLAVLLDISFKDES